MHARRCNFSLVVIWELRRLPNRTIFKEFQATLLRLHVDSRRAQSRNPPLRQTCNALYVLSVIRSTQQLIGRYTRKPPWELLP
jgi:hypothetical protein